MGETTKVIEVKECPHNVLETVIDFMYGIDLPCTFSTADVESLLFMADLYLMEDLKDAVASHMAPRLNKNNILNTFRLAEKFNAKKLEEVCSDFIETNISVANQVLGLSALTTFYNVKGGPDRIKKDMIVQCNTTSNWCTDTATGLSNSHDSYTWMQSLQVTKVGSIGRIIAESDGKVTIKWKSGSSSWGSEGTEASTPGLSGLLPRGNTSHLDILTPPVDISLFKDK